MHGDEGISQQPLLTCNAHHIVICNMAHPNIHLTTQYDIHNPILKVLGRRAVLRARAPDCNPPLPGITPGIDPDADAADADPIDTELEIERLIKSVLLLLLLPP